MRSTEGMSARKVVGKAKKLASKSWAYVNPSYRRLLAQDRRLRTLESNSAKVGSELKTMIAQNKELAKQLNAVAATLASTNKALEANTKSLTSAQKKVDNSAQKVDGLQKKFVNTLYNKSNYFEIDSELGVFTVKVFRDFLIKNEDRVPELVARLKSSLDEESCATIDVFLERVRYLLPERLPGDGAILYRKEDLFTDAEQEPYKSGQVAAKAKAFRARYDIGANKTFLCPIFYESGLVFLSDKVLETIKGSVAIDCGAYWGDTAIVFSEYGPSKVYAFEPVGYWHKEMTRIIELNNLENTVVPVRKGVSSQSGKLTITEGDTTSFLSESGTGDAVDVVTLDQFVGSEDQRVGLIKYDVEGMDFEALRGSEEIIKKDKPILLTSIYHSPEHFFGIRDYIDSLSLGYNHKIRKLAKSPLCDVMLISWVDE